MITFANIDVLKKGQLAYIVINRPKQRNALTKETLEEITEALEEIMKDETVACLVFTGQGDKSFAAGADIGQLREKTVLDALSQSGMQHVYNLIEGFEKPTIAMINGYALGGGCELAMSCDIRVASTSAKLGLPELNLSIIPSAGGTQRLVRIVGKGKALELILMGKMVDADEALRIGLVSEVAKPEELEAKVEEVANQILSKGPLAVKLAKIAVNLGSDVDMKTGLMIEKLSQAILFSSEDKREGTTAFLEKRKPEYQGK
ncbi:enoyl-CoA hydratase/isomerase family protein [Priestia megaterium]|uniref:enoyl-CoA hydratase/isomerase family protein n=1 Tax=Priestia megaterium TaxID=1404 RepID=UPI0010ADA340|nr:enoyl-CoA hydratase-related protein [Priestia megaterium]TJZ40948.1 enoyl-CoA hydratase/isomerase family protein [Priestia megaterium]